ncbi:hypothetical protein B0H12DRAFT_1105043 [Mycena haematopus]|nr:hypothetical protein B0H12DRAFT_1105043 [Mycena haematopus]
MSFLSSLLKICCGGSQSPDVEPSAPQQQQPQQPQTQQPQAHPQPEAHAPQQEHRKEQHHKHKPHKPPQAQEAKPPPAQQREDFPALVQPAPAQNGGGWQEVKPEHRTHTPAHSPSPPPSSSPPHRPDYPRHHSDQNQLNQRDAHYVRLRADANAEGDSMARCFAESHEAYARGDGAGAKQLSNEGKEHQAKMNALNKEASDWIFIGPCTLLFEDVDSKPGEIDLHGLYVKEAIDHTDKAIQEAKNRGDSELHLIVGKGLHSQGHVAKIKPAIEELCVLLDPQNAGVLICKLDSEQGGVGSDEIARRLERNDEGCTIM